MDRSLHLVFALMAAPLAFSGCKDKPEAGTAPDAAAAAVDPNAGGNSETAAAIANVKADLKAGKVDEAAAKLAGLQVQQAAFSNQQAKDYRQAMSDAYDQAIEAAQKGDPKAKAAIELLRSAAPR